MNGSITPRPTSSPELDAPVYLDAPLEGTIDTVPHAQLMRLGGLTKYGMWASFGLTTISVAATKFYVDHQVRKSRYNNVFNLNFTFTMNFEETLNTLNSPKKQNNISELHLKFYEFYIIL